MKLTFLSAAIGLALVGSTAAANAQYVGYNQPLVMNPQPIIVMQPVYAQPVITQQVIAQPMITRTVVATRHTWGAAPVVVTQPAPVVVPVATYNPYNSYYADPYYYSRVNWGWGWGRGWGW